MAEEIQKKNNTWYRRTEKMLYNYPSLNNAIERLNSEIAWMEQNKMPSGTARYGEDGSPATADKMSEPESYADKREHTREKLKRKLDMLQSRKDAIDNALSRMDEESYQIINLWYFQNWKLNNKGKGRPVWKEIGITRRTFSRRRAEIVKEVARWLGELVDLE